MSSEANVYRVRDKQEWLTKWRRAVLTGAQSIETVGTEPAPTLFSIEEGGKLVGFPVISWDIAQGFLCAEQDLSGEIDRLGEPPSKDNPDGLDDPGLRRPLSALKAVRRMKLAPPGHAIFVLKNFYQYFNDDETYQEFSNHAPLNLYNNRQQRRCIHFLQDDYDAEKFWRVAGLKTYVKSMPFPLPTKQENHDVLLAEVTNEIVLNEEEAGVPEAKRSTFEPDFLWACAEALVGVERSKASEILYDAIAAAGGLKPRVIDDCRREVAKVFESEGLFEIVPAEQIAPPEQLGGIGRVVAALEDSALTFTDLARAEAIDPDLGLFLCGAPGTGKTEAAKTSSVIFQRVTGRPFIVVRIRMGNLLDKYVGESEKKWRRMETVLALLGPKIIFIDELDKFARNIMNGGGDGGSQVYQSLLSYMLTFLADNEKKGDDSFVIFGMNSPAGIPDELMRPGRIDRGYFFDLPKAKAREEILKIHFAKRLKRMKKTLDDLGYDAGQWAALAQAAENSLPAGLENAVKEARKRALKRRRSGVPEYIDALTVITEGRMEKDKDTESRQSHTDWLQRMETIRKACRAAGAIPADADYDEVEPHKAPAPKATKPARRGLSGGNLADITQGTT